MYPLFLTEWKRDRVVSLPQVSHEYVAPEPTPFDRAESACSARVLPSAAWIVLVARSVVEYTVRRSSSDKSTVDGSRGGAEDDDDDERAE